MAEPTTDLAAAIRACRVELCPEYRGTAGTICELTWRERLGYLPTASKTCDRCRNIGRIIPPHVAAALRAVREAAARLCVFRSCSWSPNDDLQSEDYRRGVEDAASQLVAAIRQLDVEGKSDG